MSKEDKFAIGVPLVILSISAVFAYLATDLVSSLGSQNILLAYILSGIVVFFFAVLSMLGLGLAIATLFFWMRYYWKHHRYPAETKDRRQQNSVHSDRLAPRTYMRRQVLVKRQPPANTDDNGC